MNSNLGLELIVYGVLTAILSVILSRMVPDLGQVILITGLAGGALCTLWGIRAAMGHRRRAWALLTLAIMAFIFLSQAVMAWMRQTEAQAPLLAKLLLTILLVFTVGLLVMIAYADQNLLGPAQKTKAQH